MASKRIDTSEVYALLYSLIAELSELPYDQYPHKTSYELQALCDIFAPQKPSVFYTAFRMGLLKWQQNDVTAKLEQFKTEFEPIIKQYIEGDKKVLGFLIGRLVKEGCDPIEAKDAILEHIKEKTDGK